MGSQQRRTWWASTFGISVLLLACGCGVGLLAWLVVPFTPFYANYIPTVRGKLDLLAPAEWRPSGSKLSPDGHYMLVGWQRSGIQEYGVWDTERDAFYPEVVRRSGSCWINSEQYLVLDSSTNSYYLVRALGAVTISASLVTKGWEDASSSYIISYRARWRTASEVYVITGLVYGGYTIFTIEENKPYVYLLDVDGDKNSGTWQSLLQDVSYQSLGVYANIINEGDTVPSSAHPWFARLYRGEVSHLRITDAGGAVLAEVGKPGWHPALLGWAHDGSGVYVQFVAQGGAASVTMPYRPIFKLSPYTPEEARQAQLWRLAWWAGGSAAGVGAIGGIVWRRRRAARKQRVA